MDIFPPQKRSSIMSAIRSKGNFSTEKKLALLLRRNSITGWRRHLRLPGSPDFAFREGKVAVFVDGDFWHGNPETFRAPLTRTDYWQGKISRNRERDVRSTAALLAKGWLVIRIWESELRRQPELCLQKIRQALADRRVCGDAASKHYDPPKKT